MTGPTPTDLGAVIHRLWVDEHEVALYRDGSALPSRLAPRPFLHPVRTLRGVVVTDAVPADHHWHLGVSVAIQDVGGVNIWGGRTFVADRGYQWLDDHGRVEHRRWRLREREVFAEELGWIHHNGDLLDEVRRVAAVAIDEHSWVLDFSFSLDNSTGSVLELGSPGSKGREGGGYGGFFWRLPPTTRAPRVFTAEAEGEAGVHGRPAPWLAFSADTGNHRYSLVFMPGSESTAGDPWFVRVAGYPGVGSALAYTNALPVPPGGNLRRRILVVVSDLDLTANPEVERLCLQAEEAVGRSADATGALPEDDLAAHSHHLG